MLNLTKRELKGRVRATAPQGRGARESHEERIESLKDIDGLLAQGVGISRREN